jgi:ElaB/YqjD/DUF883 family membrane-anchored ribosome-binding protein
MSDATPQPASEELRTALETHQRELGEISNSLKKPEHAELATALASELPETMEAIQKLLDRVGDIAEDEARPVCEKASSLLERSRVLMKEIETRTGGEATKAEMGNPEIKQVLENILTKAQAEGERRGGFGEVDYRATNMNLHRLRILGVNYDGNVQLQKVGTGRAFSAVSRENFLDRVEQVYTSDSRVDTEAGVVASPKETAVVNDTEAEKTRLRPAWEQLSEYTGKQLLNGRTLVAIDRIEPNKKNNQCTIHFTPVGGTTAFTEKMKQKNWETSAWKFPEEAVSGASDSVTQKPVVVESDGTNEKFDLSRILKEAASDAGEGVVSQEDIVSANERITALQERVKKLKNRFGGLAQNDPLRERVFNAFEAINQNAKPFTGDELSERWEDGLRLLDEHEEKLSTLEREIANELGISVEARVDTKEALPDITDVNRRLAELKKSVISLYDKTRQGRYSKDIQQRVVRAKRDIMAGMDATPDLSATELQQKKKRLENFEVRFQKLKDGVEALSGGEASVDNEIREEEMTGFASLNYDTLLLQTGGEKPTEVDVSLAQLGVPELLDVKSIKGEEEFVLRYADGIELRVKYIRDVHDETKGVFRGWVRAGEGKKRKQLKQEVGVEVGQTGNFEAMFRAFKEKIKKISASQERSDPKKSENEDEMQVGRSSVVQEKKIDADAREIQSFNERLSSLQDRAKFFHDRVRGVQNTTSVLTPELVSREHEVYSNLFSTLRSINGQMSLQEFEKNRNALTALELAYRELVDMSVRVFSPLHEDERYSGEQETVKDEMRGTNLRIESMREQLESARVDLAKAIVEKHKASGVGQKLRRLFGAKNTADEQYSQARTQYDELLSQLATETEQQRAQLQRVLAEESRAYKTAISAEMISVRSQDTAPEKVGKWIQKVWNKMGDINLGSFLEKKGKTGDQDAWLATYARQTGVVGFTTKGFFKLIGLRPLVALGLGVSGLWTAKAVMSGMGGAFGTQAGLDSLYDRRAQRALSVYDSAESAEAYIRQNMGLVGEDGIKAINKIHKELEKKQTVESFGRTPAQQSEKLSEILTTFESYAQINGRDVEDDAEYRRVRELHEQVAQRLFEQKQEITEGASTEIRSADVQAYIKALGLLGDEDEKRLERLGKERTKRWAKIVTSIATGGLVGSVLHFIHGINETWSNAHDMSEKPVLPRAEVPVVPPTPESLPPAPVSIPDSVPPAPEFRTGLVATDIIPKGGALLNSLERLQANLSTDEIAAIRNAHVADGERPWAQYSDDRVLRQWRLEQAKEMGHSFNASGQSYDNVYHAGAKVSLVLDEHGYPRASLGDEHVTRLQETAFRPGVEERVSTPLQEAHGKLVRPSHTVEEMKVVKNHVDPVTLQKNVSTGFEDGHGNVSNGSVNSVDTAYLGTSQNANIAVPGLEHVGVSQHGETATQVDLTPTDAHTTASVDIETQRVTDRTGKVGTASSRASESSSDTGAMRDGTTGRDTTSRVEKGENQGGQRIIDSFAPATDVWSYDTMKDMIDRQQWSPGDKALARKYATFLTVEKEIAGTNASGVVDGSAMQGLFYQSGDIPQHPIASAWIQDRVSTSVEKIKRALQAFQQGLGKGKSFISISGGVQEVGISVPPDISELDMEAPTEVVRGALRDWEVEQMKQAFQPVQDQIDQETVRGLSVNDE